MRHLSGSLQRRKKMSEKFMKTELTDLNPYKLAEMLEVLENTVELHSISVR